MTKVLDIDWKCTALSGYQWTSWKNSYKLDEDGNDYEFLENHDVCDSPTYVEAREVASKYDWVGSSNKLAYPINASDINTTWGIGISTAIGYEIHTMNQDILKIKFRFACVNDFQKVFNGTFCTDFEARFCCPKRRQRQASSEASKTTIETPIETSIETQYNIDGESLRKI